MQQDYHNIMTKLPDIMQDEGLLISPKGLAPIQGLRKSVKEVDLQTSFLS